MALSATVISLTLPPTIESISRWNMLLGRLAWSHTPYMVLQVRRILLLSLIGLTTGSGTLQIGPLAMIVARTVCIS